MSENINQALGLGRADEQSAGSIMFELKFPDGTISRYPLGTIKDLVEQGRIQNEWPARKSGFEEWSFVSACLDSSNLGVKSQASLHRVEPAVGEREAIIAAIGQRSLVGLLKGEGLASTRIVLTEARIYGNGQVRTLINSSRVRVVAEISKLSSISIEYRSKWIFLFLGALSMVLSFFALILTRIGDSGAGGSFLFGTFIFTSMLIGPYFITRRRLLVLNISGHVYDFSISGISEEEVTDFVERALSHAERRVDKD